MKTNLRTGLLAATLLAAALLPAGAQDLLSREDTLKLAAAVTLQTPSTADAPLVVDTDLKRGLAGYDGEYGALLLPETKLTSDAIQAAGKQPVPIGHLWLKKLTPVVNGDPVGAGRLRMVDVRHDGEDLRVPLCLLGVRRGVSDALELVVYAKGKEPLLAVPLSKIDRKQELPIEIGVDRESDSAQLHLYLGGKFRATLTVTELPE